MTLLVTKKANGEVSQFPPTKTRHKFYNEYSLHFCNTCKGWFDLSKFSKCKTRLFELDAECTPCKKMMANKRQGDGIYSRSVFGPNSTKLSFPKPARIKAAVRAVSVIRKEFEQHKNPTMIIYKKLYMGVTND